MSPLALFAVLIAAGPLLVAAKGGESRLVPANCTEPCDTATTCAAVECAHGVVQSSTPCKTCCNVCLMGVGEKCSKDASSNEKCARTLECVSKKISTGTRGRTTEIHTCAIAKKRETGETCGSSYNGIECQTGLICTVFIDKNVTAQICVNNNVPLGGTCNKYALCAQGSGLTCVKDVVVVLGKKPKSTCQVATVAAAGSVVAGKAVVSASKVSQGQPCAETVQCEAGLECVKLVRGKPGSCTRKATRHGRK